jgi:hypothetical protein
MGKHEDFSSEEMEFLVGKFRKKSSNREIYEEIQENTTYPARSLRSIQTIRRIYDAVNKAYNRKLEIQSGPESITENPLKSHLNEVSETANKLADNIDKLLYYKGIFNLSDELPYSGNIVGGLIFNKGAYEKTEVVKVENHMASYALKHYQDRWETAAFSDRWEYLTIKTTKEVLKEVCINLMKLASLNTDQPCDECPKCQQITGIITGEMEDEFFNKAAYETQEE